MLNLYTRKNLQIRVPENQLEDSSKKFNLGNIIEAINYYKENGYVIFKEFVKKEDCNEILNIWNTTIKKYDGNEMINYATSFFALSHTVHGDVNNFTNKEIINFSNLNTTSAKGK